MPVALNLDLAAILLKKSDNELFEIVQERFKLGIQIIDKYINYINGNMAITSAQAWQKIGACYPFLQSNNYIQLYQNQQAKNDFLKFCETDETKEIDAFLKKYNQLYSYDNFDVYFEKYFGMEEIK